VASRAHALFRRVWTAGVGLTLYLAPLVRDALVHLVRLGLDVADGAQYVWRRWRAARQPDTASRFDAWRGSLRQRRAVRWAPWAAQTKTRRLEVGTASVALLLIALVVVRTSSDRQSPAVAALPHITDSASAASPAPPAAAATHVDLSQAIERMRSNIARAGVGHELYLADGPVLAPGASETWSGFRVAAPAILADGAGFRLWYRGCRLHGFEHDCAIGHATSTDGLQWTTAQDAVLVPSDGVDEFDLGWIAVSRTRDTYLLWYSVAPDEFKSRPTSVLHLATSEDGLRWQDHGRVLTTAERTMPVQPSVVHDGTQYHLWFADSRRDLDSGYEVRDGGPFLRHFTSPDGRAWQEAGEYPIGALGLGRVRLSVNREGDGSYRAFFFSRVDDDATGQVASSVGWLASADGNDWRVASRRAVTMASLGRDVRQITDAAGVRVPSGVFAWFVTQREDDRLDIRAAFYKE
jgi:hypothetical protein